MGPPITGNALVLTGNDPGTFTGAPLKGTMGLHGQLKLIAYGGVTLLGIPLSVVGVPGAVAYNSAYGVNLTAVGAAWTAGTAMLTLPTTMGGSRTTSFAGYDNRVNGAGTVQLVTPIRFDSNIAGAQVIWSSLRITYVPEPGSLSLLGAGTLILAAVGRRARERRRRS